MTAQRYPDDDDAWIDPNLAEPKLQDDLDRRLGLNRRIRQRPRAAYGSKSAPDQQRRRQTELTQIRYFKYVPYNGMTEPEKRRYLSLGPARLTSSRTAPPQPEATKSTPSAAASFWPSASLTKSLKVYDYHLAELSMTYRSPPSLLDHPRRQLSTPTASPRPRRQAALTAPRRPLFFQLHSGRGVPASAPSATQQQLQPSSGPSAPELAEKTTQVSRSGTPFIDSALSDYPTEPRDVVSKSDSNRLLNVVSVDECHVQHRRRRRRLRRVHQGQQSAEEAVDEDAWENEAGEEPSGEGEEYEEEEEEKANGDATTECAQDESKEEEEVTDNQALGHETVFQQPEPQSEPVISTAALVPDLTALPSASATRPTTERSGGGGGGRKKRRTEKEMRQIAAAKFLRRNEILREKMAIYLDWKLNQERMGLVELRLGDPAARFERFTVELVQQEAMIASQYRDSGSGAGGEVSDAEALSAAQDTTLMEPQRVGAANKRSFINAGPSQHRQEMSLTEMYEALNA